MVTELCESVFTECTPTRPDCQNKLRDTGYNCYASIQVDAQNSNVCIGGNGFLQMSFRQAIYMWGIIPNTTDAPPKHYHPPDHTCNPCS
jgi:hypothetical protein